MPHGLVNGNKDTDGSTGEAVIQMSQMSDLAITGESMLSGNDPCVAVCISSGESRDNQGHWPNSEIECTSKYNTHVGLVQCYLQHLQQ